LGKVSRTVPVTSIASSFDMTSFSGLGAARWGTRLALIKQHHSFSSFS
jgi:hypothetical protein